MKKIVLVYAIAAFIACSCTGMQEAPEISGVPMVLTAYQEGMPDSKTAVENGGKQVFWEPGDEIKVFSGSRSGKFTSSAESLEAVTTFTGYLEGNEPDVADIWAVYPYSDDASFDGETITTVIPSVQVARPGTFAQGANVAIAHSTTTSLQFYNVGGGIRFSLTEEGVSKVIFEGLGGEVISGTVKVGFEDGLPKVKDVFGGSMFITLTPPEGESFIPGQWYYLIAVPGTLESGFKLRFYKQDAFARIVSDKIYTIKRHIFGSVQNIDQCITFESLVTSFPETDEDKTEAYSSLQELLSTAGQVWSIVNETATDSDNLAESFASEAEKIEGVVSAELDEEAGMVSILTDIGLHFNVSLRDYSSIMGDITSDNGEAPSLTHIKKKEPQSSTSNHSTPIGKQALILSQYQSSHIELGQERGLWNIDLVFLEKMLSYAGYSVTVKKDDEISLDDYKVDNLNQYSLIMIFTHGAHKLKTVSGHTSTGLETLDYLSLNEWLHMSKDSDLALLVEANLLSQAFSCKRIVTVPWLEKTTNASYPKSVVFIGACDSFNDDDLKDYFIRSGAIAFGGFRRSTRVKMISELVQAVVMPMCLGAGFVSSSIYAYNDVRVLYYEKECRDFKDDEGCNPDSYRFTNSPDVYLFSPSPYNLRSSVDGNVVTLLWDKNGIHSETLENNVFSVYVNDDKIKEFQCSSELKTTFTAKQAGTYNWYVRDDITINGEVIESFISDVDKFTVADAPNTGYVTPEAVDLGLSVKWASFNLGASKPEEYGDYFAWGETEPKMSYSWDNYLWGKENSITRYNAQDNIQDFRNYGYVDDAANKLLKGYWHVPSSSEYKELIDNSSYEWCILNGTPGMKFTSTKSGFTNRWIFLPATGGKIYSSLISPENGYYWSSTVSEGNKNAAVSLSFFSSSDNASVSDAMRYAGQVIRPVCD